MATRKEKELCLGCSKTLAKTHCHQCTVCGLWIHKACSGISEEFFKFLEEQVKATGTAYWACRPCTAYAQNMNRKMKELEDRVTGVENSSKANSEDIVKVTDRVAQLEATAADTSKEVTETVSKNTESVYNELRERERPGETI